ncbi:hypothetical protein EVAR_21990_1 [Eumeta japonica]|uniref:Uncharacterized protein n=1 Tax=Eumeta variegata TaxID=151549 RepID=A0A4C1VXR9_EUMVA|nr:hypothetical protein EVAR_21990_1 [Eumeta japonica]
MLGELGDRGKWATGTLTHWIKCNNGSSYLTSLFCESLPRISDACAPSRSHSCASSAWSFLRFPFFPLARDRNPVYAKFSCFMAFLVKNHLVQDVRSAYQMRFSPDSHGGTPAGRAPPAGVKNDRAAIETLQPIGPFLCDAFRTRRRRDKSDRAAEASPPRRGHFQLRRAAAGSLCPYGTGHPRRSGRAARVKGAGVCDAFVSVFTMDAIRFLGAEDG